jgi:nicotinate-nucleotide--dimethylbenzimidazole phosphoribosyltransferase
VPEPSLADFPPVHLPAATVRPPGRFGRLAELRGFLTERGVPSPARPRLLVVAGDHGVATAGVSAQDPGATAQEVELIRHGAGVAALAAVAGAGVLVADVSVSTPAGERTRYFVRTGSGRIDHTDALTADELEEAVRVGRELADAEADAGTDLLLVGHLGVGGTTPAAVIVAALVGAEPVAVVGRGSRMGGAAIDDATWMRKAAAVRDALRRAKAADRDAASLLRIVGGADLAALAGLLAQSAARRLPVVLDGLVTLAAALVADRLAAGARAWWLAGQAEPEPVHRLALDHLGLAPLLDLGISGGDGSGALAALPLMRMAGALAAATGP